MRCLSCNKNLTDREASQKYTYWREITNVEDRYVCMCTRCTAESGVLVVENPLASDKEVQDETEVDELDEGED